MKTSIFIVSIGIILLIVSFILRSEQISQRRKIEGTTTTAVAGAVVGGVTGVATGSVIGGIGIAALGTGIGIPAGLVMLGLGALFAGGGAAIGHAVGEADKYEIVTSPMFSPWVWGSLMLIAFVMIAWGSANIWIYYNKTKRNE